MKKDTILVVDDEPQVRSVLARYVRRHCPGYTIVEAKDGVEALEILSERIALIISDVNMPRMSGFELCRSIRAAPDECGYADLPIILLTGLDSEQDVGTSWDVGSTLHVGKPFDPDKLDAALRQVFTE